MSFPWGAETGYNWLEETRPKVREWAQMVAVAVEPGEGRGVVLLARAGSSVRNAPATEALTHTLSSSGISPITTDLLHSHERDLIVPSEELQRRLVRYLRSVSNGNPSGLVGIGNAVPAVLRAAASEPIGAVVVIGGELAVPRPVLQSIVAPVLLLIDRTDADSIERVRDVQGDLRGPSELHVMPSGSSDRVMHLVNHWMLRYLDSSAALSAV